MRWFSGLFGGTYSIWIRFGRASSALAGTNAVTISAIPSADASTPSQFGRVRRKRRATSQNDVIALSPVRFTD
jgi:hypothetical protein